jgi:taurine--2-oxoglutarate transaminase
MDTAADYWERIRHWDEAYYLHLTRSHHEFEHVPVTHAEGPYFHLADGTRVLDFASQTVCANLGHRHPRIVGAMKEVLDRYTYVTWGFCTDVRAQVAKLFLEDILGAEGWAGRLRITSSGAEAMETALALAKLCTGRPNVVSLQYAFHGSSALSNGGATWVRAWGGALASDRTDEFRSVPGYPLPGHFMAPAPFCYRCPVGHTYPACKSALAGGVLPCVYAAERMIRSLGPETVAAFVVEPVLWTTGIVPPPEFLGQVRELTRRLGIHLVLDEVVTGFGRTGSWFHYQHHPGVFPDLLVMGKGLASGAAPCGGVVVSKELDSMLDERRWCLGGTMASHPLTSAAILGNVTAIIEEDLLSRAAAIGGYLARGLEEVAARHPSVGLVSGLGLMWALELVSNPEAREPFVSEDRDVVLSGDLSGHPNQIVFSRCWRRGLLVGGYSPNVVQLTPPLIVTEAQCDQALEIVDEALADVDALLG